MQTNSIIYRLSMIDKEVSVLHKECNAWSSMIQLQQHGKLTHSAIPLVSILDISTLNIICEKHDN